MSAYTGPHRRAQQPTTTPDGVELTDEQLDAAKRVGSGGRKYYYGRKGLRGGDEKRISGGRVPRRKLSISVEVTW